MDGKVKNDNEELVAYTAPLLPGGARQDVTVAVNGELLQLKRGVAVDRKSVV